MNSSFHIISRHWLIGWQIFLITISGLRAESSFSDLNIECSELRLALKRSEACAQQFLASLEKSRLALELSESNLRLSRAESAVFERQAVQMKLRIESLGINSITQADQLLEDRLLQAVSEVRRLATIKSQLMESVVRLSVASSAYVQNGPTGAGEARANLEAELRQSNRVLEAISAPERQEPLVEGKVTNGVVTAIKEELNLVVLDVGRDHGIKLGMPLRILRKKQVIGSVRVVDVRQKVTGAVIQNLVSESNAIQLGDLSEVEIQP